MDRVRYETYITKGGEMLDEICAANYGDDTQLKNVLSVNRGLEFQPLFLPAFIEIKLPIIEENQEVQGVSLW